MSIPQPPCQGDPEPCPGRCRTPWSLHPDTSVGTPAAAAGATSCTLRGRVLGAGLLCGAGASAGPGSPCSADPEGSGRWYGWAERQPPSAWAMRPWTTRERCCWRLHGGRRWCDSSACLGRETSSPAPSSKQI